MGKGEKKPPDDLCSWGWMHTVFHGMVWMLLEQGNSLINRFAVLCGTHITLTQVIGMISDRCINNQPMPPSVDFRRGLVKFFYIERD